MGFCKCGPNELGVGQECGECGYIIPDENVVRKRFLINLIIAAGIGIAAFIFLALPFTDWATSQGGGNYLVLLSFSVLWCAALSIKTIDIMGPYHDGKAEWEKPKKDGAYEPLP